MPLRSPNNGKVVVVQSLPLGEDKLMLSERVRSQADATAVEVAQLPSGSRPEKYDLVQLRELVEQRLLKRS